jgi:hypothetical protein
MNAKSREAALISRKSGKYRNHRPQYFFQRINWRREIKKLPSKNNTTAYENSGN